MAELLQAVSKTSYPNGKTKVYEHGMIPTRRTTERINVWYRWLHVLNLKNEKNRSIITINK